MKLRINPNRLQQVFKDSQNIQELIKTTTDLMFAVCPFTIILGTLNTTEAGYKPANLIVNNYTNFSKVFTGRESVLAVWDDCYETSQVITPLDKGGDETNNYGIVKVKQNEDGSNGGKRYYGRLLQSAVITSFKPNAVNDTMSQMSATKTVNLIFEYGKNEVLFDEITNNIYKFFIIPELFEFKDSKDNNFLSTDRQWYYLENCVVIYNSQTKKPEILQATFTSVNDVISKSGLAINQYIQISAPGDRCCFPTVDKKTKKIICDKEMLKYHPITHAQISLFGNVAFSNIMFMGRKVKSDLSSQEWNITAPSLIFPYKFQCSFYDELMVNAVPETCYYSVIKAQPLLLEGWQNWKEEISATYNNFANKQYEGVLVSELQMTQDTNKITEAYPTHNNYWGDTFLTNSGFNNNLYNVSGCEYFYINPFAMNSKISITKCGLTKFNPNSLTEKNLRMWNFINYFICKQFYQLPLSITQTTPVALSSLPIIGGFLNTLLAGLPIGFSVQDNIGIPILSYIPILFSCGQYDFLTSIYGTKTIKEYNQPIFLGFDTFKKDTANDLLSLCGTTSQTTSFCFNLTSTLSLLPTIIDGKTTPSYGRKETIETTKLGQITKDLKSAYLIEKKTKLETPLNNEGFVIDAFSFQAIGQVPYRITFYSQPTNVSGALDPKKSVWTGIYKTLSNASQNTRQWTNFMILSNPQYRFDKNFYYPQNIEIGPTPKDEFVKGIITNWESGYTYLQDIKMNNQGTYLHGMRTFGSEIGETRSYDGVGNPKNNIDYIYIDDLIFNEKYQVKQLKITIKTFKIGIHIPYASNSGETNLSKAGNYWFYYWRSSQGDFPIWGRDYKNQFDQDELVNLTDETLAATLDFTKDEDDIIFINVSKVFNDEYLILRYGGSDEGNEAGYNIFHPNNWTGATYAGKTYDKLYGNFIKTYLNTTFGNGSPSKCGIYYYLGKSEGNIKLTFKKTREEQNNRWKVELSIDNVPITCYGAGIFGQPNDSQVGSWAFENHPLNYTRDSRDDVNPIYCNWSFDGIDNNAEATYWNKDSIIKNEKTKG